ncbi:hypothetical protein PISMIDRAFT_405232 [Pisolithus microcarpus 441]|uniref:Uncharacterized protein n=1 Tax=Pisolithus microcarpus 441 TaxID=765257 RepID=A0A0C9XLY4_9AGAM|nr:hypothetical protein PISMIDRAFT_405232 [Pisolithus microcarpus 441]
MLNFIVSSSLWSTASYNADIATFTNCLERFLTYNRLVEGRLNLVSGARTSVTGARISRDARRCMEPAAFHGRDTGCSAVSAKSRALEGLHHIHPVVTRKFNGGDLYLMLHSGN